MYKYVLVHFYMTGMSQYELGCTSMYWYILAYFVNSGFSHTALSASGYEAVQGGTRQYQKVLYPWIWRYKAVQGLVPSCTSLYLHIQGYRTFWYCLVPHCTNFHCLVPPCTALYPEEDKRIQGCMREYQKGQPGMNQFVSVYSS